MVNPIDNNVTIPKAISRDNKQSVNRGSGDTKDSLSTEPVIVSLSDNEAKSLPDDQNAIILNIISANKEASSFNLEDKEAADNALRQTVALMIQNPEMATLSQINISSKIVLNICHP